MCGDNRYVDDLRILTAIELYLNSEFYSKHPSFISLISKHSKVFSSIDTILAISVSHNALDSNKTKGELVQNEAINICTSFKWAGFLCVLGLASVCSSSVQCYYKNTGSILKYKLMFSQLIEPRLFNPFSTEKIHLLFCNNTCEPPVPFMHNHYVPLIICSQKNAKNKGNRKHKLSPHSTSHLKSKNPCGQSSIKAFLNKSLPENKGNLNMNTSESCAVVRSFSSSSVLSPKLLFSSEKSRNVENSLFNKNLEVPTSSSSLEIPDQCISKDISVKNLEEPSNIISTGKYDNCNINYPEKFVKIVQNSNSASNSSPGVLEKADNLRLSNNSNYENISFSFKKPTVVINSFNSTTD